MNAADPATAGVRMSDELRSSPAPAAFAKNLYYDSTQKIDAAKLLPGEYFVCVRDMLLVTVLGSCVAACVRDVRTGMGGMNHFMLPDSDVGSTAISGARYGAFAMDLLINHLLKLGARRDCLEAKVFGGGNVLASLTQSNVGHKNAAFVTAYLRAAHIPIASADLADVCPRKVYFFPASGRVLVKRLTVLHNNTIFDRESGYRTRLTRTVPRGNAGEPK